MNLRTATRWAVRISAAIGVVSSLAVMGVTRFSSAAEHAHFKITGGSMAPTLDVGEVITVRTAQSPRVGDVITFLHDGKTVTHRVMYSWNAVSPDGVRHTMYKTKGDANRFEDSWAVLDVNVIGTLTPTPAVVSLVVILSEHPLIMAALFIPFLLSILMAELRNIWNILLGKNDDEECPERESNPQGVATRGV